jgi:hypothetical protein
MANCRPKVELLESKLLPGETFWLGLWMLSLTRPMPEPFSPTLETDRGDAESAFHRHLIARPATADSGSTISVWTPQATTQARRDQYASASAQPPAAGVAADVLDDVLALSALNHPSPISRSSAPESPGHKLAENAAMVSIASDRGEALSGVVTSGVEGQAPGSPLPSSPIVPAAPRLAPGSMAFDPWTGEVAIRGYGADNTIQESLTPRGYVDITLDGQHHSSDPASAAFDPHLAGATATRLTGIRLDGDGGQDTLILGLQQLTGGLNVTAPGAEVITEDVTPHGPVTVQASNITIRGTLRGSAVTLDATAWVSVETTGAVVAEQGDHGGRISVIADKISNTGQLRADGQTGGRIDVQARNILNAGSITADGTQGPGGTVSIAFMGAYIDTVAALTTANGNSFGRGGHVLLNGGATGRLFSSGRQQAMGGVGGSVDLLGREVVLDGNVVDVSGETGGGSIRVGGDFHGRNPTVANADTVTVTPSTTLRADAQKAGDGGRVAIWSDTETWFQGAVSAHGGLAEGLGGFIEVSGRKSLTYGGSANATAQRGKTGTLLLDPKNLIVSTSPTGVFPQFDLLDPHPTAGGLFSATLVLSNGNIVATSSGDNFGGSGAGAAYLFDGSNGVLISSLFGSNPNDSVGFFGAIALSNGHYLVRNLNWNGGRGAVTWGSGVTGVNGIVSETNSLVGSRTADLVGSGDVIPLTNGNYLVVSPYWQNLGALTWGNGTTGTRGVVSETNSLVGGAFNVITLNNGNYLATLRGWNDYRGAVTWGSGAVGISGIVSQDNSLVGANPGDQVGFVSSVTLLPNGNYVVDSVNWNGNRGAVTWGSGTAGVRGIISEANSLVGTSVTDKVGYGVIPLGNGNYVVESPYWNGSRGAVTWGSGTAGVRGIISEMNSLVGTNANDRIGLSFVPFLPNGNYVVPSASWNSNRGAVTWGSGTAGISGVVSEANSLVGASPNDAVGGGGVTTLANGNYVVRSPSWGASRGAVTWADGRTGTTGVVSEANSLVGANSNDAIGAGGSFGLPNGNYVVASPSWAARRGAVTWVDASTRINGVVSEANSLVGANPGDAVGNDGVVVLANGNYVVRSLAWNNSRGAVTWADGGTATRGTVSETNSLVGSTPGDLVGFRDNANPGVIPLANGNLLVYSARWNGFFGALTWEDGTAAFSGTVSIVNSVVGSNPNALTNAVLMFLPNGNYVVGNQSWNNNRGVVIWGSATHRVSGPISDANSVFGSDAGDRVGGYTNGLPVIPLSDGNYLVHSGVWNGGRGAVTWVNGTTGQKLDGKGTITAENSVLGRTANDRFSLFVDSTHNSFVASFAAEGSGRVTVGLTNPNQFTYAHGQLQTVTLTPSFLTATLNTGTAVVLQASNDITIDDPITVNAGGQGGALTLQAGRSILLNADITTDNGSLTLIANDTRADGVVDSQRDPGNAVILMAGGTILDTGTAPLDIELRNGAGLTHADSRAINLQTLIAGSVNVVNDGPDPGSDIRLGPVITTGPQSYGDPNGTTLVTAGLTSGDYPITFTDSVVVGDGVSVDAGSATVNFADDGMQTLQSGDGAVFSNLNHTGDGILQLTSGLAVASTLLQGAGTFDANDQPVTVRGTAVLTGGTYLAGTAPQTFAGGLVLTDGTFTSSTGPMSLSGDVTLTGGTFGGDGTADSLTVYRGTLAPGTTDPGVLAVANAVRLTPLSTFSALVNGPDPGTGYSQLTAGGPLDLGGSTLNLALGFAPPAGSSFVILTTADAAGVRGTFAGLPEGAVFSQDGYRFQITYRGGDAGNSVVLTCLA